MNNFYKDIANYYSEKILKYGCTPKGVDWNSEESQLIRFKQLSKIIEIDRATVNDIGCGYGKYAEYLIKNKKKIHYKGYDFSKEMIKQALKKYPGNEFYHITNLDEVTSVEYSVSSGIFNVKMNNSDTKWLQYILDTLKKINSKSEKGFAFDILNFKACDKKFIKNNLYYANSEFFYNFCKKNFSDNIMILDNYGLYEFTILIKKN